MSSMMRPGHKNGSQETEMAEVNTTPQAAADPKDATQALDEKPKPADPIPQVELDAIFLQPLKALSSRARMGLMFIVALTTIITLYLGTTISRDKAIYPLGALSTGQLAAFWVCLGCITWWGTVVGAVAKDVIVDGEDRNASFAKYVTDEQYAQLSAAAEFSFYILLFFFCDRTTYIPRTGKSYNKDTFWTLWVLLCGAGLATLRKAKPPTPPAPVKSEDSKDKPEGASLVPVADSAAQSETPAVYHVKHLQRDQTEEWKGWMQVMFLWYHYFNAKDIYNAIRLYIAAYVWMTGFGNFSYYYIRRDFSFARFCQMQWRLNFMVVLTCAMLGNEYMLYYICMLHTTFTLIIYAVLGIQNQMNTSFQGICIKFGICVAVAIGMWDVSGVFDVLWAPFTWLVQYHDPYKPERPIMHEWQFRSHLDHLIWIVGMFMAYNHPRFDSWLEAIDRMPTKVGNTIKTTVFALCIFGFYLYNELVFSLPKKEYNALHPYTSFIPIVLFIVMRNIFTTFRMYHMHLFEFLGKTTLETYIAQFHIWMATTGANGAPKKLLRILPEGYPLLNFLVLSVVFFYVSYRLFQNTNTIKTFVLPAKVPNAVLQRNVIYLATSVAAIYMLCGILGGYITSLDF